ncbi:MAG: hypothetical protein FK731_15590 [Asgard group archaeon]|nr:hypothetical protein [Asgard group archaeon]
MYNSATNQLPSYFPSFATGTTLGAGLGGLLGALFPGQSPAEAASPYMEQIAPTLEKYFQPYIATGQRALPTLEEQYTQLLTSPESIMGRIGAGFQESPGYQWQLDQMIKAANQAAAAGGMLGTPAEQQKMMETAGGLASQDYYDYLNKALGLYGQGLTGTAGLGQMGAGASQALAENLANALASQAQLAYAGQAAEQERAGGLAGTLGGLAGGVAGLLF